MTSFSSNAIIHRNGVGLKRAVAGQAAREQTDKTLVVINDLFPGRAVGCPITFELIYPDGQILQTSYPIHNNNNKREPSLALPPACTVVIRSQGGTLIYVFDLVVANGAQGAFVVTGNQFELTVDQTLISKPNAIGAPPVLGTDQSMAVPPDTTPILVGNAYIGDVYLEHSQYWNLSANSYSLPPGDERRVVFEQVSGTLETDEVAYNFALAVGVNVSGSGSLSYSQLSATLSASLSFDAESSSAAKRTVSVTQQSTVTVEDLLKNTTEDVKMVLIWELTDIFITYTDSKPTAALSSRQAPPVIQVHPSTTAPHALKEY